VADEEYGSLGTSDLLRHAKTDGAIVTEPTALDVCLAHKGYLWIEVEILGRAAHGSKFDQGIDANMKMGQFLAGLSVLERDLRARPPHPLVGPPSLHAALLNGGSGLSTYAASSKVQIERRTIPGETEAQAVAEIQAIVDALASEDPAFRAQVRPFFVRNPFGCRDRARSRSRGGEGARTNSGALRRYTVDGRCAVAEGGHRNGGLRRYRRRRACRRRMGGTGVGHPTRGDPG
jgi:acetylornithine deacetylase